MSCSRTSEALLLWSSTDPDFKMPVDATDFEEIGKMKKRYVFDLNWSERCYMRQAEYKSYDKSVNYAFRHFDYVSFTT